jgi:hypothetical protein
MTPLIQLVYISRSSFAEPENFRGSIEPNAEKILLQARIKNRKNGLTGVLCFGDCCFLQCLEGEEEPINNLLMNLQKDDRHTGFTVLWKKPIKVRWFERWEMKFVAVEGPLMKWLASLGYERFDPYQFDETMVARLLNFLRSVEPVLNFQSAAPDGPGKEWKV